MKNSPAFNPLLVCAPSAHAREGAPTLPRALKARINQLAHQSAQQHEQTTKEQILNELLALARSGARPETLFQALTGIEINARSRNGTGALTPSSFASLGKAVK